MYGSCSTNANDPFFLKSPFKWGISPRMAYNNDDLPEPTFPTIPYYFPFFMLKVIDSKTGGLFESQKQLKLSNSTKFS